MSLRGTLKDFGIAEILQLIGQQQKTGTLHVKSNDHAVDILFREGGIVHAESTSRGKKDLIGAMLVRAGLIDKAQLETALGEQRRTLKRLGDVLVAHRMIAPERFLRMVHLQMEETLYGLFEWKTGTYQFEQGQIRFEGDGSASLRAESVLMEGFRRLDEWPVIRKTIPRMDVVFEVLRALPSPAAPGGVDDGLDEAFDGLDEAFGEGQKEEAPSGEFRTVGENERIVFAHVRAGRDVQKLADLSCLGEFETCKALCQLVHLGYLKPVLPTQAPRPFRVGLMFRQAGSVLVRGGISAAILAVGVWVASQTPLGLGSIWRASSPSIDPAIRRLMGRAQRERILFALELYQLEGHELPASLQALVDLRLLTREDLHYPWREPYYYRRTSAHEFILLPPLR